MSTHPVDSPTGSYDSRKIFVGRFDDEVQAARAYDQRATQLFGEFAYLNYPHGVRARSYGEDVSTNP